MGRPRREWAEGASYHLFTRGSNREPLFRQRRDYSEFMTFLAEYAVKYSVDCFAWALMPNHWHLLVRCPAAGLSAFVKPLNQRHSIRANRRNQRSAHLFKNRFGCTLQESTGQFLWTVRYILRNPVEAAICSSVMDAPWTSYQATVGLAPTPSWLLADEVLAFFGSTRREQIQAFDAFLEG